MVTDEMIDRWLDSPEGERLEFKEARRSFDVRKVEEYLAALANEGGGHLVLGVSDAVPRRIVGTEALQDHQTQTHELTRKLGLRITFSEFRRSGGRVLVASVGPRHVGQPVACRGRYLMRAGESLVAMTNDQLQAIFAEQVSDPSALPVSGAARRDLDPAAIDAFRELWATNLARRVGPTRAAEIHGLAQEEVVERAGLVHGNEVTIAALVLLGSEAALRRFLPSNEVVYEYRDRPGEIQARIRRNVRKAFVLAHEELWQFVEARNPVTEIPAGMLRTSVPAFGEESVREAIMNAVAHRDYRRPESVFVRHDAQRLVIESPGGFPPTVTPDNVLDRQVPRNRSISESLERAGFVERSGQGADIMFREAVRDAKPLPSFEGTDDMRVVLTLSSMIRDPELVRAMDAISREDLEVFDVRDFLVIDHVAREGEVPRHLWSRVDRLVEIGVLESRSRGRHVLSRRLYAAAGRTGAYTRATGLDRQAQLELAYQHLRQAKGDGAPIREFMEIFPDMTRFQVFGLLDELRRDGRAHVRGKRRRARWYAGKGA
ncbi:MAG: ATP-binding protein [Trueperaceae bacterium]|nr:ATP-binding protein [Trueperaceae bacterium]